MDKAMFKTVIEEMFGDAANERRGRRLNMLQQAHEFTRVEATIVDDAFLQGTKAALLTFAEHVDSLTDNKAIRIRALPFLLRGFASNVNELEDLIVQMMIAEAVASGAAFSVVGGSNPDCGCPTCTAARLAREQATTRH